MSQYLIQVSAVPSQKINVVLDGQNCSLFLREMDGKQYLSLSIDGEAVFSNAMVCDRIPLKKYHYLPLKGDIASADQQGTSDPDWRQWNTRFLLVYSSTGFENDGQE